MNYRDLLDLRFKSAKYHGKLIADLQFCVLHHTAAPKSKKTGIAVDLSNYLANPGVLSKKPSAHAHIGADGIITLYTNILGITERRVVAANHAGVSAYDFRGKHYVGISKYSIGLEIAGDTNSYPLEPIQREALIIFCKWLKQEFPILNDKTRWLTHTQIAIPRGRKNDLGTKYCDVNKLISDIFDPNYKV